MNFNLEENEIYFRNVEFDVTEKLKFETLYFLGINSIE